MTEVFIAGRSLISALGRDLSHSAQRVAEGGSAPTRLEVGPGVIWPYYAIADDTSDWNTRARALIRQAVAECWPHPDRDAPLFLATCSLDIGAREEGGTLSPDCFAVAEKMAGWLAWRGPLCWISTACTSSLNAVLAAHKVLENGRYKEALILGVELRNRFTTAGFGAMQLLDTQPPRPLAEDRGGLVLGEAVAALRLSTRPTRWRLRGGANVVDGSDPAGATESAVMRMTQRALDDSSLEVSQIDLIKLQAAGSLGNDATELQGLSKVFPTLPPVMTLKAQLGHTLGASGASELALTLECLEQQIVPPPVSAPDAALPPFSQSPRSAAGTRRVMANILGFGGGHTAVIIEDSGAVAPAPARSMTASMPGPNVPRKSGLWQVTGRYFWMTPPANWHQQLVALLGYRPRRLGEWVERALFGALLCMQSSQEPVLPENALLSVSSTLGPDSALRSALEGAVDGFPLPLGFLQSQPNQVLPALGQALSFLGNARMLCTRNPVDALRQACAESGQDGCLLGWVEEGESGLNTWLRLMPAPDDIDPAYAVRIEALQSLNDESIRFIDLGGE